MIIRSDIGRSLSSGDHPLEGPEGVIGLGDHQDACILILILLQLKRQLVQDDMPVLELVFS